MTWRLQRPMPADLFRESKVFAAWPYGWDARAARRCAGLLEVDPVARKRQFKARFRVLFKY